MGRAGKNPPQRLAPPAAGGLFGRDAAPGRPQGDRARGVDDVVVVPDKRAPRARSIHTINRGIDLWAQWLTVSAKRRSVAMGPGSRFAWPGRRELFILPLVPPREIIGHVARHLVLELRRALFQERHYSLFHVARAAAGVDAAAVDLVRFHRIV